MGFGDISSFDDVMAELNSSYRDDAATGPQKCINDLRLEDVDANGPANRLTARIGVGASHEGLHGDTWDGWKSFAVPLEVIGLLAGNAPRLRMQFTEMFNDLSARLAEHHTAFLDWCDEGLPVQEPVQPMKRLRVRSAAGGSGGAS